MKSKSFSIYIYFTGPKVPEETPLKEISPLEHILKGARMTNEQVFESICVKD